MMGIKMLFSSAYHPQIDRQMECQNYTIQQLVSVVAYKSYNWVESLKLMELALNNTVAGSTGMYPAHVTHE